MYLRKNKVRCGDTRRTYLSIAHNVWWSGEGNKKAQSRPIVIASFGVEDKVDVELARELVVAVENVAPKFPVRRGEGKAATMRIAQEVRKIEPFLKLLASRKLGLREVLPQMNNDRTMILENLVRDRLADPDNDVREDELMTNIRSRLSA